MNDTFELGQISEEINHQRLRELLPQRFPFLMLDRVVSIVPGERLVAIKNVTGNEIYFQGHFPDKAVMPGVMILEGMAQSLHVLAILTKEQARCENDTFSTNYLSNANVKFIRPVFPGDQIMFETLLVKRIGRGTIGKIKARVDGQTVAEGEVILMVGKD